MIVDEGLIRSIYPTRSPDSRKGNNGRLLVVGGSWLYHGAPVLASLAAQRTGVDLLYLAVPKALVPSVRAISPDFIVVPLPDLKLTRGSARRLLKKMPEVDAMLIGPGLGRASLDGVRTLLQELIDTEMKYVLDADALRPEIIPLVRDRAIITPHPGEYKRLFNMDLSDMKAEEKAEEVLERAKKERLTIALKGRVDIVSDGREVYLNRTGNSGMSVGGTGDVLSGMISAFAARGLPLVHAAILGVYFNGLAGDKARDKYGFHFTASMMLEEIPSVMKPYDKEG